MRQLANNLGLPSWWDDPWIRGTIIVSGGLAAGLGLGAIAYRLRYGPAIFPDCDEVTPEGGVVAGVSYFEAMRGGAAPEDEVPMVVAFHSLCAPPRGILSMFKGLPPSRLIVPAGSYGCSSSESSRKWWSRGVRSAMDAENIEESTAQWRAESERMGSFLAQIQRCRPTKGKPVLTGSSMGGEMSLLLASTHPMLVDSAVVVSGYLLPEFWTTAMAPTSMIHGTGDTTVPFSWAKEYAQRLSGAGADLSFEEYATDGHSISSPMGSAWGDHLRARLAALVSRDGVFV